MLKATNLHYFLASKGILEEIDLLFVPGKVYGIFGPNGSGKTSLLHTLAGLSPPTKGSITLFNQNLGHFSQEKKSQLISLVPQHSQVHFDFSLQEFVSMGLYPIAKNLPLQAQQELVKHTLKDFHLNELCHQSILTLSGGELKRAYLARSLVSNPKILLLDEPTTFLDLKHQDIIWRLLGKIAKQNKIVIVATHDLSMAKHYCEEVVILKDGKCFTQGLYDQVMHDQIFEDVFEVQANRPTSV